MDKMVSKQRRVSADMDINEQKDNLSSLIANPPQNSRVVEFSPELAAYILENHNIGNRSKKRDNVSRYAKSMSVDNWSLTGVPLLFSKDGILIDGQNRLSACVKANTPFMSHVVFGVDPDSHVHIDVGKMRNNTDLFTKMGINYPRETGMGLRMLVSWSLSRSDARNYHMDLFEMRELYETRIDKTVLELCIKKAKAVNKNTGYPTAHLTALMYFAWKQGHSEKVKTFMDDLISGYGTGVRSPVRLLLSTINRLRMDRFARITTHMYAIMLTRTWQNYLEGKASKMSDMKVGLDDTFPIKFSL